jgi:hypothetical protein
MVRPSGYFDLIETLPQPGCAVCNLLVRDVEHYLDSFLYEYVNDPASHLAFREGRGLCNKHGWQLRNFTENALGIAILYNAALDEALTLIKQPPGSVMSPTGLARLIGVSAGRGGAALADRLEPTRSCPVCESFRESEERYIQILGEHLDDARVQEAYQNSVGLCLPHFRQALRAIRDAGALEWLITAQREIWGRLKAELEDFIRKNNQYVAEPIGAERDSWLRAIGRLSGEAGVFGTR